MPSLAARRAAHAGQSRATVKRSLLSFCMLPWLIITIQHAVSQLTQATIEASLLATLYVHHLIDLGLPVPSLDQDFFYACLCAVSVLSTRVSGGQHFPGRPADLPLAYTWAFSYMPLRQAGAPFPDWSYHRESYTARGAKKRARKLRVWKERRPDILAIQENMPSGRMPTTTDFRAYVQYRMCTLGPLLTFYGARRVVRHRLGAHIGRQRMLAMFCRWLAGHRRSHLKTIVGLGAAKFSASSKGHAAGEMLLQD
ncbi:hypothetical protein WJX72_008782 [[Myrmecia] bisecta]|uniref:Endonuclease/exonuclease/phosphatase domain-containing protein n=1 Tax=[Myrmecia] bisecta TaxID=41462 RepID=A0AAW1P4Y6_9CHLO